MTTFYFVAGEQVVTIASCSPLDAFLALQIRSERQPIAAEFFRLPVECFDADGNLLAKRKWQQWRQAVLLDTYGENFQDVLDNAVKKL